MTDNDGTTSSDGTDPVIVADDLQLTFHHGKQETKALDHVSFRVERGTTLALVGQSGSGKSTTARTILGIQKPDAGRAIVCGSDVHDLSQRELRLLRQKMQVVLQDPFGQLNRRHTVGRIIEGALIAFNRGSRRERRERVAELIRAVGLDESYLGRNPRELSGGQCQRVAIARALALQPELVVLDEAVSALDVSVRAQILNMLVQLQKDFGLTYLFITHDLAVARYMAHDIAVMHRGRIVEHSDRDTLFANPKDPYTQGLIASIPVGLPRGAAVRAEFDRRLELQLEDG